MVNKYTINIKTLLVTDVHISACDRQQSTDCIPTVAASSEGEHTEGGCVDHF